MKFFILSVFTFLLSFNLLAQQSKDDTVIKLNGEQLIGKVTEINDDNIKFVHKGEKLTYTIKKSEIAKIIYGSGRVEEFAKANTASAVQPNSANKDKIAVLPFHYIYDQKEDSEEMAYKVQSEAYNYLNGHTGNLQLQDPMTTNATLLKAGITTSNIRTLTTTELCNLLSVEYVIIGTVGENAAGVSKSTSTTDTYKNKSGKKEDQPVVDKNGVIVGNPSISNTHTKSTTTTSTQQYDTNFNLKILNDKGETVYNQDRTSMLKTTDAYKSTLQYLLKRIPLYTK